MMLFLKAVVLSQSILKTNLASLSGSVAWITVSIFVLFDSSSNDGICFGCHKCIYYWVVIRESYIIHTYQFNMEKFVPSKVLVEHH